MKDDDRVLVILNPRNKKENIEVYAYESKNFVYALQSIEKFKPEDSLSKISYEKKSNKKGFVFISVVGIIFLIISFVRGFSDYKGQVSPSKLIYIKGALMHDPVPSLEYRVYNLASFHLSNYQPITFEAHYLPGGHAFVNESSIGDTLELGILKDDSALLKPLAMAPYWDHLLDLAPNVVKVYTLKNQHKYYLGTNDTNDYLLLDLRVFCTLIFVIGLVFILSGYNTFRKNRR
jgi:hypothetical protein